ncbi:TPA: hypothetical protein J5F84_004884 [Escherichia coli]|nr:hypothetical protein [Escherichia coli]
MKKTSRENNGQLRSPESLAQIIDDMPEDVLIFLHNVIVRRLNLLQRQRNRQSMMNFCPGDRVCFCTDDGRMVTRVLVRLNKKTVTVHTENGEHWNVSPLLLTSVECPLPPEAGFEEHVKKFH